MNRPLRLKQWMFLLGTFFLTLGPMAAEDASKPKILPKVTSIDRTEATRGRTVRLTFDDNIDQWLAEAKRAKVFLGKVEIAPSAYPQQGSRSLSFTVPDCGSESFLPLGVHTVEVTLGAASQPVAVEEGASRLTIVPDNGDASPKITRVFPPVSYPVKGHYALQIQGDGFARHGCDNRLSLGGEIQKVCWDGDGCTDQLIHGEIADGQIDLSNIPKDRPFRSIGIKVGAKQESVTDIRLSWVQKKTPVRLAVSLGLLVFFGLLSVAVRRNNSQEIGGQPFGISRLFIDAETETYSLSKFQFFLWTLVAVFSYLYLSISTWLVQGKLEFLDMPEGLPGIVMISAATTVASQLTQTAKGPKAAGDPAPSFRDLVSVGNVVLPERFQFLLWTILGAAIFLFVTFLHDPATIVDLPTVPQGFLMLMGISAAGYLGGKIARKPGPVIDQIQATQPGGNVLRLVMTGRCLSTDATFRISARDGVAESIPISAIAGGKPTGGTREEPGMDSTLFKSLDLQVTFPVGSLQAPPPSGELTIINPDGQTATVQF